MMKKSVLNVLGISGILWLAGCGSASPTVASVGSEKISLSEFEDSFAKNNGGWDNGVKSDAAARKNFLELLVKFRLKVAEAKAQGLMNDSAIVSELENYQSTVAQSYSIEKEIIEPGVRALYEKKKEEVRVSHILIRIPPGPFGKRDTAAAYKKASEVLRLAKQSVPFDSLARAYSEDEGVAVSGGDVGYFSIGRMVPEFEDAAYALRPGELAPGLVRTQFGYHIIKAAGRQPNKGPVDLSHIFFRFAPGAADSLAVLDTAFSVYRRLQLHQLTFDTAVQRYSGEPTTASNGGHIGVLDRSRIPTQFVGPIFELQKDSISKPVRSPVGYHVFRVNNYGGIGTFDQDERELKQLFQTQRYDAAHAAFVSSLRQKYAFSTDEAVREQVVHSLDTTKTPADSAWADGISKEVRGKRLFSSTGGIFTVGKLLDRMRENQEFRSTVLTPENVRSVMDRVEEAEILSVHLNTASDRHPKFLQLMNEYRDGVLMYRVEQDEVWKQVVVNDSILQAYYDTVGARYRWPERIVIAEIFVTSDSLAKAAYWRLQYGEDFSTVAEEYTMRRGFKERKGEYEPQALDRNQLTKIASSMTEGSVTEPFRYENGWSIVKMIRKEPPRQKTFPEASAELAGAYQEIASARREQEWVNALKKKFNVTTNESALADAFKGTPRESK